jgi:hypothetical protein
LNRLVIHERILADGGSERTWLDLEGGQLVLGVDDATAACVDLSVLEAVMKRYGKPIAGDVELSGPALELGGGRTLSMLRHRARYDVIAKDFLVYRVPGDEPLAELSASVSAALTYLVRLPPRP